MERKKNTTPQQLQCLLQRTNTTQHNTKAPQVLRRSASILKTTTTQTLALSKRKHGTATPFPRISPAPPPPHRTPPPPPSSLPRPHFRLLPGLQRRRQSGPAPLHRAHLPASDAAAGPRSFAARILGSTWVRKRSKAQRKSRHQPTSWIASCCFVSIHFTPTTRNSSPNMLSKDTYGHGSKSKSYPQ